MQFLQRCCAGLSALYYCANASTYHPQGFDEFMNVVVDDAEEVWVKQNKSKTADGEASGSKRRTREYGQRTTLGAQSYLVHNGRLGADGNPTQDDYF